LKHQVENDEVSGSDPDSAYARDGIDMNLAIEIRLVNNPKRSKYVPQDGRKDKGNAKR
jgi:hypothetical protein